MEERFWSKVDAVGPCWLWTAAVAANGYGVYRRDGKTRYAHRLAWEFLVGPIPEGMVLDHLCRIRHCVNPDHTEIVTQAENLRRGFGNGNKARCPQNHPLDGLKATGFRYCKTCNRLREERRARAKGTPTRGRRGPYQVR
ncbi:HNH endonuclease signature motif containing protein [Streptomyces sp. NPDC058471]|uniref:HNH endonuclease signature motif containing protein n=1 Tax=Streptomyces sp. NPDC058471 TaxID=3346516 RepID=UPI003656771D